MHTYYVLQIRHRNSSWSAMSQVLRCFRNYTLINSMISPLFYLQTVNAFTISLKISYQKRYIFWQYRWKRKEFKLLFLNVKQIIATIAQFKVNSFLVKKVILYRASDGLPFSRLATDTFSPLVVFPILAFYHRWSSS